MPALPSKGGVLMKGFAVGSEVVDLSDAALIDVVCGIQGAGASLLRGDDVSNVYSLNYAAIAERTGLPLNNAQRVAAAFTIAHRIRSKRAAKSYVVDTIGDAVAHLKDRARLAQQEEVWLIGLDLSQRITGMRQISVGTANQAPAEVALVMRHACEIGAHVFILVHFHVNGPQHPPKPSLADLVMTVAIRKVARDLDILLLDHLLIGRSGRAVSVLRQIEREERAEAKRKAKRAKREPKRRTRKPPKDLATDDGPDTERDPYPVGVCP